MTNQKLSFQDCYFSRKGSVITLGNSRLERAWQMCRNRLMTIRLCDKATGRDWIAGESAESVLTTDDGLVTLSELTLDAISAEVIKTPVSSACLRMRMTHRFIPGFRLSYGSVTPDKIHEGIELLADAARKLLKEQPSDPGLTGLGSFL